MSDLLRMALINAAMAAGLALAVGLAARVIRRPSWIHALWLLVLLRLLTPPLFGVAVLPRPEPKPPAPIPIETAAPALPEGWSPALTPAPLRQALARTPTPTQIKGATGGFDLARGALALWLAGSVMVLALTVLRGRRFRRLLRAARSADTALQQAADEVALRMGVRRAPRVLVVPAAVSPMLWWRGARVCLLFPEGLLSELSIAERDTLLAHELAHLKRKDHWVRLLEVAATSGFWWHPAVWWARAGLRKVEEQSCDGWVVRTLPGSSRPYADALLKTLSFLSHDRRRLPALASGVGEARDYEERLTMILQRSKTPLLARPYRLALAAAGVALLLAFPTWADRTAPEPPAAPEPTPVPSQQPSPALAPTPPSEPSPEPVPVLAPASPRVPMAESMPTPAVAPMAPAPVVAGWDGVADAGELTAEERRLYQDEFEALEVEAMELQSALREIRERQARLSRDLRDLAAGEEMDRLREEMDRLEAAGQHEEAEALRQKEEMLQRRLEKERQMMELKYEHQQNSQRQKEEFARMKAELARAERDDVVDQEMQHRLQALEADRARMEAEAQRRYHGVLREQAELEAARMSQEAARLREGGEWAAADEAERRYELMLYKMEELERQKQQGVEREIQALRAVAEKLEARGEMEEADRVRAMIDEMESILESQDF